MSSDERRETGPQDQPNDAGPEASSARPSDDGDPFSFSSPEDRWDANDPRRKNDSFAPPTEPCECHCLHCGRTFLSTEIWFQKVLNDPKGFDGFWMCPTPNCSGAGFTFDLFPTDPEHPANAGWHFDDEGEEDAVESTGDEIDEFDEEDFDEIAGDDELWSEEDPFGGESVEEEYDPAETKYKSMDELFGDDDDLEGEEWKLGLQPGERPELPDDPFGGHHSAYDETKYDEPDQRPRELDWSDREDRKQPDMPFKDDDIPF